MWLFERSFEWSGEEYKLIKVVGTKGTTGHTMGASIEEAIAAKALQYQKIPPVANFKEIDHQLDGLNLSKGGEYNFEFALRCVIAFGGQGNYQLLQKIAENDRRIINDKVYQNWLNKITSSNSASVKKIGQMTVAEGDESEDKNSYKDSIDNINHIKVSNDEIIKNSIPVVKMNKEAIFDNEVLDVISEITKYPVEMLEKDMELEADLGIDTIKQATIFSCIGDKFNLQRSQEFDIREYSTIKQVIDMVRNNMGSFNSCNKENEKNEKIINKNKYINENIDINYIDNDCELSLQIPVIKQKEISDKALITIIKIYGLLVMLKRL